MATIFSNYNVDFSEKYLGHTPLSLAVLMGNQVLVETIMKLPYTNPHQSLDYGMGNVLTIYILKRYEDIIPPNAKEILDCLVNLGANLLKHVNKLYNAIEFMDEEHAVSKDKTRRKSTVILNGPPKKNDETKAIQQKKLKDYIKELGRNTIMKYIQIQAVENLYNLIEDNEMEHECVKILAEFLTPFVVISNLQHLFRHGKIKFERYNKDICLQLIDIVNIHRKEIKPVKTKTKEKKPKKSNTKKEKTDEVCQPEAKHEVMDAYDYSVILDITDFNTIKKADINFNLLPPGIDNAIKYEVCFHCLKRSNKVLLLCPRCQLIYFCSDVCNKANLKLQTIHTCNINFYASISERLKSPDASEDKQNLSELYNRVRENCEKRWLKKREEEIKLKKKKIEEEMKSDIYGIRFLRRMNQLKNMSKTPTLTTLLGSASNTGIESEERAGLKKKREKSFLSNRTFTSSNKIKPTSRDNENKNIDDKKYKCMVTKKHVISLLELEDKTDKEKQCKEIKCVCKTCAIQEEHAKKIKHKCIAVDAPKKVREKFKVIKENDISTKANAIVKKLRQIPSRYREFIELLTKYFPDVDFSSLFLPYACYSNGQMYYKFLDKDFYTKTYSMM